jgi:hypothetical protein
MGSILVAKGAAAVIATVSLAARWATGRPHVYRHLLRDIPACTTDLLGGSR